MATNKNVIDIDIKEFLDIICNEEYSGAEDSYHFCEMIEILKCNSPLIFTKNNLTIWEVVKDQNSPDKIAINAVYDDFDLQIKPYVLIVDTDNKELFFGRMTKAAMKRSDNPLEREDDIVVLYEKVDEVEKDGIMDCVESVFEDTKEAFSKDYK